MESDAHRKLRPQQATPPEERCSCEGCPPLLLRSTLGPNPLSCAACNLEVLPERLGISSELAEALATWRSFHDCFYLLWLDSGEFEDWAWNELSNPRSPVNSRGLSLRAQLEQVRHAYYWWFQEVGGAGFMPLTNCPVCGSRLLDAKLVGNVCESCGILVAN
jgi:hypothetical protein